MNTTMSVRVDEDIKLLAQNKARGYGISLSTVINNSLKNFVQSTRLVIDDATSSDLEPTEYLISALKDAEEEHKLGTSYSFKNNEDALSFLRKQIGE